MTVVATHVHDALMSIFKWIVCNNVPLTTYRCTLITYVTDLKKLPLTRVQNPRRKNAAWLTYTATAILRSVWKLDIDVVTLTFDLLTLK